MHVFLFLLTKHLSYTISDVVEHVLGEAAHTNCLKLQWESRIELLVSLIVLAEYWPPAILSHSGCLLDPAAVLTFFLLFLFLSPPYSW